MPNFSLDQIKQVRADGGVINLAMLDWLIDYAETTRMELYLARQTNESLRDERSAAANTSEELRTKLTNMDRAFQSLYTSACKTRTENAVLRGQVDELRAELDARDLTQVPMGGEAS